MNKWFFINVIILIYALWKVLSGSLSLHTILGLFGLICIIHNWMRHALFSTIRSNISRTKKIYFANISKKFGWLHKWFGTSALIIIIAHALVALHLFPFQWTNIKLLSGILAMIILFFVVIFGWLRFIKTTVKRRYIHWSLAYTLIIFVIIHLSL